MTEQYPIVCKKLRYLFSIGVFGLAHGLLLSFCKHCLCRSVFVFCVYLGLELLNHLSFCVRLSTVNPLFIYCTRIRDGSSFSFVDPYFLFIFYLLKLSSYPNGHKMRNYCNFDLVCVCVNEGRAWHTCGSQRKHLSIKKKKKGKTTTAKGHLQNN